MSDSCNSDYVSKAERLAKAKREKAAEKAKQDRIESDRIVKRLDNMMSSLKEALAQFHGQAGLSFVDCGNYQNFECAKLIKSQTSILSFTVSWKQWIAHYSDDCSGPAEGPKITIRYLHDKYPERECGDVEECMEYVTDYLSKYF